MYIKSVLVRFFKSFNYDYLRKNHPSAKPEDWETINGAWFPFVRVPLCHDITTVVGANESGKSQLLGAIKKALTGQGIGRLDFCRYSEFFTVQKDKMRLPDFGLHFSGVSSAEQAALCGLAKIAPEITFTEFILIRDGVGKVALWISQDGKYTRYDVADGDALLTSNIFPSIFEIDSDVALPASIPISWLRNHTRRRWLREERESAISAMDEHLTDFVSEEKVRSAAPKIISRFATFANKTAAPESARLAIEQEKDEKRYQLARDLLFTVANIDEAAIEDLAKALAKEDEGLVNGILQQINDRLAIALNFPKWWVQDRNFQLVISARDDDLVFTIRDRTRTEYSFGERSNGLKYFLSYYIQYLSHRPTSKRAEILLMDEPDAYLSSQGQQDLLKIFNAFACPIDGRDPIQVVYVTHSPFLIDRNHAERIRVLEKGAEDEGTRVVNDASKNHYEPLRSSFGAFVGETAFIGNCNVMVEGIADQILLAGTAGFLRTQGAAPGAVLDLNRVTVVPAGSASHIPYLAYLARGRDVEQPSVIVLLDSDQEGLNAKSDLKRGGALGKQVVKPEYVLSVADLKESVTIPLGKMLVETEDLIPPKLAASAARLYLESVCGIDSDKAVPVDATAIVEAWTSGDTQFDAINAVAKKVFGDAMHIDKIGFARSVIEVVRSAVAAGDDAKVACDVSVLEKNMKSLHSRLTIMQRAAERETVQERVSRRFRRTIKAFFKDHQSGCRQDEAIVLLEDLEASLDQSDEAEKLLAAIIQLRRKYDLAELRQEPLDDFQQFKVDLGSLEYAPKQASQAEVLQVLPKNSSPVEAKASAESKPKKESVAVATAEDKLNAAVAVEQEHAAATVAPAKVVSPVVGTG